MPEVREHGDAPVLDLGGLRIFVLVDHVLVDAVIEELMDFRLDPRLAERGEVLARVAVEEELVANRLVDVLRVPLVAGKMFFREHVCEVVGCEHLVVGIAGRRGGEGHNFIWC